MASHLGQPSRDSMTMDSAKRLTPAVSSWATAKLTALTRWLDWLNRRRMNSGTLCTREE